MAYRTIGSPFLRTSSMRSEKSLAGLIPDHPVLQWRPLWVISRHPATTLRMSAFRAKADIGLAPRRADPPFVQDDTHSPSKLLSIAFISGHQPGTVKGVEIVSVDL